ncbi:acyltransferase family protein [Bernardetia sp. OM2101]|uniref:acyltransferase family protein n=1 Tax=Bernardetia sp. OM2101 TaxID=3344876 RepID=UPI0035CF30CC
MTLKDSLYRDKNSIGFLRILLATFVVIEHAYVFSPLAEEPMGKIIKGLSFGNLGVYGFFVISGYLITASFIHSKSLTGFFWRRVLRIFPAFWVCLLLTVFLFAPIIYYTLNSTLEGYWFGSPENSPFGYLYKNMLLSIYQLDINNMMTNNAENGILAATCLNVSLWTLIHEFRLYILTGVIGFFLLKNPKRHWIFFVIFVLYTLHHFLDPLKSRILYKLYTNNATVLLPVYFFIGSCFYLLRDKIRINTLGIVIAILITVISVYFKFNYYIFPFTYAYILLWLAVKLPFKDWERKYGDYSYGIYIYSFVIQQIFILKGWIINMHPLVFSLISLLATLPFAFLSWKLIEKPVLRLKDWNMRKEYSNFFDKKAQSDIV